MSKNNHFESKQFFATVMTVLILIGVSGIMFAVSTAFNLSKNVLKANTDQVMFVNGSARIKAMPDIALVSYTIRVANTDVSKAAVEVADKLDQTIAALVASGIERDDIYLSQYLVNKAEISEGNVEFQAESSVSQNITVELTGTQEQLNLKLANLESVATQNNLIPSVNSGSHICLDFSDPNNVFGPARVEAVKNAKTKAYDLADAAGITLGRVVGINDNMYGFGRESSPYGGYCATQLGSGRIIEEQEVTVNVSVNFEVK